MTYTEQTTDTLVSLTLAGDDAAYEALVERYQRAVIGAAYAITRHRELAEDAAQDAFVSAWMKLSCLREAQKFGGWVCRIAQNRARQIVVRWRDYISYDLLENREYETGESIEALILSSEEDTLLHASVEALPVKVREVIRLYYFEGLSIAEIADRLSVAAGTVKWHLHEGRRKLRKEYGAMNERENDTLVERVMKKVEELKLWRLLDCKDGFAEAYADVLAEVEALPESVQKQGALADVLIRGWWWLSDEKDDARFARIKAAAEASHNEDVMQFLISREYDKLSGKEKIEFIRDKQLPRLIEGGWVKAQAYAWFWLGYEYYRAKQTAEFTASMEKVKALLTPSDVYYANSIAALKMAARVSGENPNYYSANATGEVYRLIDGKLYMWSQPGYGTGWMQEDSRAGYVFCLSGACDNLLYDNAMRVGDVYLGSDKVSTVTFVSDSETVETPCGRFTDCELWETKAMRNGVHIYRTWYKQNIGIVRFALIEGAEHGVRQLAEYRVNGGTGKIPFAPGNRWVYTGEYDAAVFDCSSTFEVTAVNGNEVTLWSEFHTIRLGWDENSWDDMMKQVRNGYCEPIDGSAGEGGRERLLDVSAPMARAAALAKTPLEIAHTRVANTVMQRIHDTDAAYTPNRTASGHWNFFNYCSVTVGADKVTCDDDRAYSFEGKEMGGTGDAGYPLLFNDIYGILQDNTQMLWSDAWRPGVVQTLSFKQYRTEVETVLTCTAAGTIVTAAGEFHDCLRIDLDSKGFTGGLGYRHGKKSYFFAPGIGIVRVANIYKKGTLTAVYDLIDYRGEGEGYMPIADGLWRHYAAQGLTDGYIGESEYTYVAREDGVTVLLENRTGIKKG